MKYVNGLCELCMEQNKIVPAKIVHHKIHMDKNTVTDSSLAYGFDNLQAVCMDCHNRIHHSSSETRRYRFENGRMIIDEGER